ncbi:MAG: DUF1015 domain-containing protein [Hyphomonadaceae bacterium]|nr:DUF1015 domain-containing protein [Clostridia bacterium]
MAQIQPFRGLRFKSDLDLQKVSTPPYDVISPAEQAAYYDMSPYNVIRLEYGKVLALDNDQQNKYTRAGETLQAWLEEGALVQEQAHTLYLYEQVFCMADGSKKSRKGIVTLVRLEEFSKKVVLPHEETLSKAKTDRFSLMSTTDCNFSQIFSLFVDSERKISTQLKLIAQKPCDIAFTTPEGIEEKLWMITEVSVIKLLQAAFEDKQLFIADGHHRYETALNYRNALREQNPDFKETDLFNYVMMMLVDMDDEGLVVFPTHRMVKDIADFDAQKIVAGLSESFEVQTLPFINVSDVEKTLATLIDQKAFAFYTGKQTYTLLKLKQLDAMNIALPDKDESYRNLDVSILHTLILDKHLGIDMANMANQTNLTYTRDPQEAIDGVNSGAFQCAFLLNATKVFEIKDVSLANEKMPQKSTYFYPKLTTGLVMNKFR